ncbi:hypothetical protein F5B17DRAFT_445512 [Nemania serpens]|nr:hypothetical protein F5B17DRAFT_445512 [Nemania serpens]
MASFLPETERADILVVSASSNRTRTAARFEMAENDEGVVVVDYKSRCQVWAVAGHKHGQITFRNHAEHATGAFRCRCRRSETPEQEVINDETICERLFILYNDGKITLADMPNIFAALKLGKLIRRAVKLSWDDDEKVWTPFFKQEQET